MTCNLSDHDLFCYDHKSFKCAEIMLNARLMDSLLFAHDPVPLFRDGMLKPECICQHSRFTHSAAIDGEGKYVTGKRGPCSQPGCGCMAYRPEENYEMDWGDDGPPF